MPSTRQITPEFDTTEKARNVYNRVGPRVPVNCNGFLLPPPRRAPVSSATLATQNFILFLFLVLRGGLTGIQTQSVFVYNSSQTNVSTQSCSDVLWLLSVHRSTRFNTVHNVRSGKTSNSLVVGCGGIDRVFYSEATEISPINHQRPSHLLPPAHFHVVVQKWGTLMKVVSGQLKT